MIIVAESVAFSVFDVRAVSLAAEHRLPTIYDTRHAVKIGDLMAYGPNLPDLYRRAASHYVGRILRGANPADRQVEQPTTFDFVFNLKTAQTLGLPIAQCVRDQATEVMQ